MISRKSKHIGIIGLGYVGLPLAILARSKGNDVVGIDLNEKKVKSINAGVVPFKDKRASNLLKKNRIHASSDFSVVGGLDIVIICVPTPVDDNKLPDYNPIISACDKIAPFLKKGQLVILESTVNPGVCEEVIIPRLEEKTKLKAGKDFFVAHCPERINPGDKNWDVSNIPRVVGGLDKTSLKKAAKFYRSIISANIQEMDSIKEAEAVKVVENSFRNVNIAFVNELAVSFARLGIDIVNVINGAATKPFSFLAHYPGCGIGGHCIPVDPYYLIEYAKRKNGYQHKFLSLACEINEDMPNYTVELVKNGLENKKTKIQEAKVTVLGLAYKADIDDCRESPSFPIIKQLKSYGAKVTAYDPHVPNLSDVKNIKDALKNADAVVLATNHACFKNLKGRDFVKYGIKVVVDGKNCLKKSEIQGRGVSYFGIGR
jgi:nucleotide sugar dehydrogenase